MPQPPRVLVVGRHPEILARVTALFAQSGLEVLGALRDDEAIAQMANADAMVIGGGVEDASRPALVGAFRSARPGRPVIEHFGGPHGLVDAVRQALGGPSAA